MLVDFVTYDVKVGDSSFGSGNVKMIKIGTRGRIHRNCDLSMKSQVLATHVCYLHFIAVSFNSIN